MPNSVPSAAALKNGSEKPPCCTLPGSVGAAHAISFWPTRSSGSPGHRGGEERQVGDERQHQRRRDGSSAGCAKVERQNAWKKDVSARIRNTPMSSSTAMSSDRKMRLIHVVVTS